MLEFYKEPKITHLIKPKEAIMKRKVNIPSYIKSLYKETYGSATPSKKMVREISDLYNHLLLCESSEPDTCPVCKRAKDDCECGYSRPVCYYNEQD